MGILSFLFNNIRKPCKETKTTGKYGYSVYQRPADGFPDNMNCKLYKCKGIFTETGRKRTVTIDVFNDDDIPQQLKDAGFEELTDSLSCSCSKYSSNSLTAKIFIIWGIFPPKHGYT